MNFTAVYHSMLPRLAKTMDPSVSWERGISPVVSLDGGTRRREDKATKSWQMMCDRNFGEIEYPDNLVRLLMIG